MKKKTYKQPQVKFIEVKEADIICTSPDTSAFSIGDDNKYEEADW